MKRHVLILLALAVAGNLPAAAPSAPDSLPGIIFAHTVRSGAAIAPADDAKEPRAFQRGDTFSATGQTLLSDKGEPIALVFSNGDSLYLPNGGRLIFNEFTQAAVTDTSVHREYEPSHSMVRLTLTQGTLALAARKMDPTSTFTLIAGQLQVQSISQSLVVSVIGDTVTITLFDGTAVVTVPETGFHDTLQAGITATFSPKNLHDSYPLQLTPTTTAQSDLFGGWVSDARRTESKVYFFGPPHNLEVRQILPVDFTQKMSIDDPRYR